MRRLCVWGNALCPETSDLITHPQNSGVKSQGRTQGIYFSLLSKAKHSKSVYFLSQIKGLCIFNEVPSTKRNFIIQFKGISAHERGLGAIG